MNGEISGSASLWRCLVVWGGVTAAVALVLAFTVPELATVGTWGTGPTPSFVDVLTVGAAAALALCAVWFWVVTSVVTVEAARGAGRSDLPIGCPPALRRLILAACGVALISGLATPAQAIERQHHGGDDVVAASLTTDTQGPRLDGLPMPDRATDSAGPQQHQGTHGGTTPEAGRDASPDSTPEGTQGVPRVAPHSPGSDAPVDQVQVKPGDSLWSIAEDQLDRPDAPASDAEVAAAWQRIHHQNRDVVGIDPDVIHPGTTLDMPDLDGPENPEASR